MGQDEGQVGAAVDSEEKSPEQIRREIEETREHLGDTAAALAAKTDVKTRAKEKVEGVKQTLAAKKESLAPAASGTGGDENAAPGAPAGATMTQVKAKAQENPIPTAAIAAFVGGFVFGRVTSR